MIELIPVNPVLEENILFLSNPDCAETLPMCIDYYKIIGYNPPWIMYFAHLDGVLVGSAGYKGKPVNNKVEIAYGTVERFRSQGIGTMICRKLVDLALETDPHLIITARTAPEEGHSPMILRKNHFTLIGTVWEQEDGDVWEWVYEKQ